MSFIVMGDGRAARVGALPPFVSVVPDDAGNSPKSEPARAVYNEPTDMSTPILNKEGAVDFRS